MILALAVRDQLPHRRASSFAAVLLGLPGVALILAAFQVDVPSAEWRESRHSGLPFAVLRVRAERFRMTEWRSFPHPAALPNVS